jgi:hypothetical protein
MTFKARTATTRFAAFGIATALSATALVAVPVAASADEGEQLGASAEVVGSSIDNLRDLDSSLLLAPTSDGGASDVSLAGGTVTLPTELSDGVSLTHDNSNLVIKLPDADAAGQPVSLDDGTVVYPGETFANSVIVGEGAVQMLTTITGAKAPTEFSYQVSLKPGQTLELVYGGAAILNADGSTFVAIGEAWAKDANGSDVPTSYSVDGDTLTQTVAHDASGDVAYPVVADPIWFAPWVLRCLAGIGIAGPDLARILSLGSPGAIAGAFGRGAVACIFGR